MKSSFLLLFFIIFSKPESWAKEAQDGSGGGTAEQDLLPTIIEAEEVPIARSARQFLTRNAAGPATTASKQNPQELVSGKSSFHLCHKAQIW